MRQKLHSVQLSNGPRQVPSLQQTLPVPPVQQGLPQRIQSGASHKNPHRADDSDLSDRHLRQGVPRQQPPRGTHDDPSTIHALPMLAVLGEVRTKLSAGAAREIAHW